MFSQLTGATFILLSTYSQCSRFSLFWRFPVHNLPWNLSFRHSLGMSIPYELCVLYFNHHCVRYLYIFPDSLICYFLELRPSHGALPPWFTSNVDTPTLEPSCSSASISHFFIFVFISLLHNLSVYSTQCSYFFHIYIYIYVATNSPLQIQC